MTIRSWRGDRWATDQPYAREPDDHYVDDVPTTLALLAVERFAGPVWDPAAGFGHVVAACRQAGLVARGSDKVDRGVGLEVLDFLSVDPIKTPWRGDIICNPPFDRWEEWARHCLRVAEGRVALVMPITQLCGEARSEFLKRTGCDGVHAITPRPSMPPGRALQAGLPRQGGKQDYAWIVWRTRRPGASVAGAMTFWWANRNHVKEKRP